MVRITFENGNYFVNSLAQKFARIEELMEYIIDNPRVNFKYDFFDKSDRGNQIRNAIQTNEKNKTRQIERIDIQYINGQYKIRNQFYTFNQAQQIIFHEHFKEFLFRKRTTEEQRFLSNLVTRHNNAVRQNIEGNTFIVYKNEQYHIYLGSQIQEVYRTSQQVINYITNSIKGSKFIYEKGYLDPNYEQINLEINQKYQREYGEQDEVINQTILNSIDPSIYVDNRNLVIREQYIQPIEDQFQIKRAFEKDLMIPQVNQQQLLDMHNSMYNIRDIKVDKRFNQYEIYKYQVEYQNKKIKQDVKKDLIIRGIYWSRNQQNNFENELKELGISQKQYNEEIQKKFPQHKGQVNTKSKIKSRASDRVDKYNEISAQIQQLNKDDIIIQQQFRNYENQLQQQPDIIYLEDNNSILQQPWFFDKLYNIQAPIVGLNNPKNNAAIALKLQQTDKISPLIRYLFYNQREFSLQSSANVLQMKSLAHQYLKLDEYVDDQPGINLEQVVQRITDYMNRYFNDKQIETQRTYPQRAFFNTFWRTDNEEVREIYYFLQNIPLKTPQQISEEILEWLNQNLNYHTFFYNEFIQLTELLQIKVYILNTVEELDVIDNADQIAQFKYITQPIQVQPNQDNPEFYDNYQEQPFKPQKLTKFEKFMQSDQIDFDYQQDSEEDHKTQFEYEEEEKYAFKSKGWNVNKIYRRIQTLSVDGYFQDNSWNNNCLMKIYKWIMKNELNQEVIGFEKSEMFQHLSQGDIQHLIKWMTGKILFDVFLIGQNRYKHKNPDSKYVLVYAFMHCVLIHKSKLMNALNYKFPLTFKLKKKKIFDSKRIHYFWDIETYSINGQISGTIIESKEQIPYCICVYNINQKYVFWGLDCTREFIEFIDVLIKSVKTKMVFWSFNGAKFDNILIFKQLLNKWPHLDTLGTATDLKSMSFFNVTFGDLHLLLPMGNLNFTLKSCGIDDKKNDINIVNLSIQNFEDQKDEIIKYCMKDCELLYWIHMKYSDFAQLFKVNQNLILTAASLSMNIYLTNYFEKLNLQISGAKTWDQYNIEKEANYGGLTITGFNGVVEGKVVILDINSSYPYQMQRGKYPLEYLGTTKYDNTHIFQEHYLYKISGKFKDCIKYPWLGQRTKSGLLYSLNFNEQYRWGADFINHRELFEELNILEIHRYTDCSPFKEFVTDIYQKRKQYKLEKNIGFTNFLKIVLNSLYGKLASRNFEEVYYIKQAQMGEYINNLNVQGMNEVEDGIFKISMGKTQHLDWIGSMVRFAGMVTAYARSQLVQAIKQIGDQEIIYMDTDSIFWRVPVDRNIQELLKQKQIKIDDELGSWKVEHVAKKCEIYGLKCYRLICEDDQIIDHCKGVNVKSINEKFWNEISLGKSSIQNNNVFKKKLGQICVVKQNKQMNQVLHKRIWNNINGNSTPLNFINL